MTFYFFLSIASSPLLGCRTGVDDDEEERRREKMIRIMAVITIFHSNNFSLKLRVRAQIFYAIFPFLIIIYFNFQQNIMLGEQQMS